VSGGGIQLKEMLFVNSLMAFVNRGTKSVFMMEAQLRVGYDRFEVVDAWRVTSSRFESFRTNLPPPVRLFQRI
jgi:hypothetical protein